MGRRRASMLVALIAGISAAVSGGARTAAVAPMQSSGGDWTLFGRTAEQNRHSPLTQITPSNVGDLGRIFKLDLRTIDPAIRRGQQSYPLAIGGVLYVTTNDNNVFAIDGTSGRVRWRYAPANRAVFANFGIVANRGVAFCDGKLFLLTLDMHIVMLDPGSGRLLRRVPIESGVPGASINYGYSETSAPVCANGRLVLGAAGSEFGVRGFVMAFRTSNLAPAWANPFWTIPPDLHGWRRPSRLVGGGVVWTPTTIDRTTNTLYFGTGSATPLYWPQLRPGRNPRTNSLIAVDLLTGRLKWWQQQLSGNQWAYDTAQPPLVYTARIGGKSRRIVSVGTMEGVWYAYDARTGTPLHQRVKVNDRTEHPPLRPGQPVVVFPSSLGGLNYSPASFDPRRNIVVNAAAETSAVLTQKRLTPTEKRRKLLLGDVFLGLEVGNFGTINPNWRDHGSISAIDVNTGRRIWKFKTPEPERGGVTTTATGLGFAGGGDGVVRVFDLRNGRILWRFQTSHPIAAGATIYSAGGRQYVAITVGGTPTSSNGGTASELHVFGLGGSKDEDPPPPRSSLSAAQPEFAARPAAPLARTPSAVVSRARPVQRPSRVARILSEGPLVLRGWRANSSNTPLATGRLLLRGRAVAGARIKVGGYVLRQPTGDDGRFRYPIDITLARRHIISVVGAARATVRGRRLNAAERRAVLNAKGAFTVAFRLQDLRARVQRNGTVLVTGRATFDSGAAAPAVVLYTYQLRGTVTNAQGRPVAGAVVITRTLDRDFWTMSTPTDAQGRYVSFFTAADKTPADPVQMNFQLAVGDTSYATPMGRNPSFRRLRSAVMDVRLPASGTSVAVPGTASYEGSIYQGLLVGVSAGGRVIRPLSARWPDQRGRFALVLPRSVRGRTIRLWQNQRTFFSRFSARPGGPVDLRAWPQGLTQRVPQDLDAVRVPQR